MLAFPPGTNHEATAPGHRTHVGHRGGHLARVLTWAHRGPVTGRSDRHRPARPDLAEEGAVLGLEAAGWAPTPFLPGDPLAGLTLVLAKTDETGPPSQGGLEDEPVCLLTLVS